MDIYWVNAMWQKVELEFMFIKNNKEWLFPQ